MSTDPHVGVTPFELLALLDSDPAAGILAAADLREQRATVLSEGWARQALTQIFTDRVAEHIAAEANPAHALAAVRRWRDVAKRHNHDTGLNPPGCYTCGEDWPCPDVSLTADEARAYLGGAAPETASVPAERLRGGDV